MTEQALKLLEAIGPMIHGAVRQQMRPWVRGVTIGFVALAVGAGVLYVSGQDETDARVDQICRLFERSHLTDVQQLRKTYTYLLAVQRRHELGETINRFVLTALPEQERQAHTDTAPQFCDEPNVGLPEPDPVVPKRPAALRP